MARWSVSGQRESKVLTEGDQRFNGLDQTRDRALLEPGMLAISQNKRLINGMAATRPACVFPVDFNPGFTNQLVGSGVFSNPNGDEVLLVAELGANFVWVLQYNKDPVQIPLDTGQGDFSTTFQVVFVQSFDHVVLLRRPSGTQHPLVWDGTYPPSATAKFVQVTVLPSPPDPSDIVIKDVTWNGEPFQQRILYYNDQFPLVINDPGGPVPDRDTLVMTEPQSWSTYSPPKGGFRINSGESSVLTRVMGYYRGGVLCFFRRGVHLLENFTTPGVLGDQRLVNDFLGCVSNQALAMVGVDVFFLSEPGTGVYRISEAVQDQIAVNPLAVSDPIQPLIDQINWQQAAYWATIKTQGVYVYVGLPIDTLGQVVGTGNNVVAVYNQFTRLWESIDTFADPDFSFQQLHVMSMSGSSQNVTGSPILAPSRLLAVDWYRKQIYGMYWSPGISNDQIGINGQKFSINDVIETRGYTMGDPNMFKRYQRTMLSIQTFDPKFNLTSISDGFNELKALNRSPITKNRLRYYIHGKGQFGTGSDPNAPKRMDYGVQDLFATDAVEDFERLPQGDIETWPGTTGNDLTGPLQTSLERYQVRQNGRYASLRVDNNQGLCNVSSVSFDAIPTQEGIKVVA